MRKSCDTCKYMFLNGDKYPCTQCEWNTLPMWESPIPALATLQDNITKLEEEIQNLIDKEGDILNRLGLMKKQIEEEKNV